jgi:transposase
MTNYREILRLANIGLNRTSIGATLGYSRNTVADVLKRAGEKNIAWPLPDGTSDVELEASLYPEKAAKEANRRMPDYEKVHKDLGKRGVTFSLLWDEYCADCRQTGEIPYGYTQFRYHYHAYVQQNKATMHIEHKPGYEVEVDWAGATLSVMDSDTGDVQPAYLFVGALPCSGYAYAEAFLSMDNEAWINAHIHMFHFFGGAPRIITPDNLKTGVIKPDYYEPKLNRSYAEMAEYYGCAILPARVKRPKDKPTAEGTVGKVTTWIIAALRDRQFFELYALNEAVVEKLRVFNAKPFQKKEGSRLSNYRGDEKEFMQSLPASPYELAVWKKLIPGFNYHICFEKNYYSVPSQYIKQEMDVRITSSVVEVFSGGIRICSHPRLHGRPGQYHTIPEHMPEKHRKYAEWNADRFVKWAASIGNNTEFVVKAILAHHKIEQQGYRACMGVLKLADRYGAERLEAACKRALSYTPSPSYKNIDSILKSGQDKVRPAEEPPKQTDNPHAFVRGAEYYRRNK